MPPAEAPVEPSFEVWPAETPEALPAEPSVGGPPELPEVAPAASLPPEAPTPAPCAPEVNDNDRLMAGLAWFSMAILQLPLVSVVLLLAEGNKGRPFQRYHAITSILFWVVSLVYEGLAAIVFTILTVISLGCLAACLWVIFFLPHLVCLFYAFQAYNGKQTEIPVLSEFARKQGWV
jgi:uncharacterized membrane protein